MEIPYGIGTYKRADLPRVRLTNFYAEKVPDVPGGLALLPRPALKSYMTLGDGPSRALFHQDGVMNDQTFLISGQTLYVGSDVIGTVPGTDRVPICAADRYLLLPTGDAFYLTDGGDVRQVDFPDGAGVTDVAYLGGYAIAVRTNTRHIYFTLDETTWDGLDYVSAEMSTANIVGVQVVVDQLWVFCTDHTEIFYLSGDSTAPIQRVQGRLFDKGCRSKDTIVNLDNTVFWVGSDSIVYRGENTPTRVSNHGIEEQISLSSTVSATSYSWLGHLFYVLQLDAATYAYDCATQQWHELTSFGKPRWRANQIVRVGLEYIASDDTTGDLWMLSDGLYNDNGDPIACEFTVIEDSRMIVDNVYVDVTVGTLDDPNDDPAILELRTSRDNGQTFQPWRQTTLGRQGQSRARAVFRRVGMVDGNNMVMYFRLTSPTLSRVSSVELNASLGGFSR